MIRECRTLFVDEKDLKEYIKVVKKMSPSNRFWVKIKRNKDNSIVKVIVKQKSDKDIWKFTFVVNK